VYTVGKRIIGSKKELSRVFVQNKGNSVIQLAGASMKERNTASYYFGSNDDQERNRK